MGFTGAMQGVMVEKEAVALSLPTGAGEVRRERWHLLTGLSSRQCGAKELLWVFRNH